MGGSEPSQQWDNLCGIQECYVDVWLRWNLGENGGGGIVTKLCLTFATPWTTEENTRLLCSWDFSGKNTGVGFYFLFQEIFPTQNQTHFSCTACEFVTPKPPGFPLGENGYMYMDG